MRHFWVAAVLLGVMGFAMIVFMASSNTTLQVTVPDALRGRLMGLYAFVFVGMNPFGALFIGSVAEKWGVPVACVVGGRNRRGVPRGPHARLGTARRRAAPDLDERWASHAAPGIIQPPGAYLQ